MEFSNEIGLIAGVFFVIAYALLNFDYLGSNSVIYQSLNFLGAVGFVYTAITPLNPGLFVTEVVWAIVALLGAWKILATASSTARTGRNIWVGTTKRNRRSATVA